MAWATMRKCQGTKDAGSGVVDRPFKLWSLIIDRMQCGGGGGGLGLGLGGGGRKKPVEAKKQKLKQKQQQSGSSRLSELLKQQEWWEIEEEEIRRKEKVLEGLKNVAKKLQQQDDEQLQLEGAMEVRKLTKDDADARTTLALLGVIPPLVTLLDPRPRDPLPHLQISALYALLNLAIANDANKAAIVKAGAVHKMLKLIQSSDHLQLGAVAEAVVANFLGLSALDSNKPIIGSSGAIPFLVKTLQDMDKNASFQAKQDSMRALFNLSICPSNVCLMLETDLIPDLFANLGDMESSERILSILSNIVSVPEGRKALSAVGDAFPILIDILHWVDSPGCQEKASYILMVMAHKSYGDRQAMIEAGIVSSLLELTLMGSTLAQKRASRMLESLRVEKGKQAASNMAITLSAPLYSASSTSLPADPNEEEAKMEDDLDYGDGDGDDDDEDMVSNERKAVKQLVQQSLHNNMKRMVRRANLPHDHFVPSDHHLKALGPSSTSKSLPF